MFKTRGQLQGFKWSTPPPGPFGSKFCQVTDGVGWTLKGSQTRSMTVGAFFWIVRGASWRAWEAPREGPWLEGCKWV